jgi:uncharacterized membrane protein
MQPIVTVPPSSLHQVTIGATLRISQREKIIHVLFDISILGKGIDGALEIVGGMLLFFVNPAQINHLVRTLTQHELSEDPNDLLAGYLLQATKHFSVDTQIFIAVYLLWHGLVKVGLVIALLQKRFWAYPTAILAFLLFLIYQLYRYSYTHSTWLLVLSVVDVSVIVITWLEYRRLRALHGFAGRASRS